MSYILKKDFRKTTRYIYLVEYSDKEGENYEVITLVRYFRWDENQKKFNKFHWGNKAFATALFNKSFRSYAGKELDDRLVNVVEVEAYQQEDGEIWIRSKPDGSLTNNLEFLTYAKNKEFAKKV